MTRRPPRVATARRRRAIAAEPLPDVPAPRGELDDLGPLADDEGSAPLTWVEMGQPFDPSGDAPPIEDDEAVFVTAVKEGAL